jgi:hypothetical protein
MYVRCVSSYLTIQYIISQHSIHDHITWRHEVMVFNTLSTIFKLYRAGELKENYWPVTSHWQTVSQNVVSSAHRNDWNSYIVLVLIGTDWMGSCKSNHHMIKNTTAPRYIRYSTHTTCIYNIRIIFLINLTVTHDTSVVLYTLLTGWCF